MEKLIQFLKEYGLGFVLIVFGIVIFLSDIYVIPEIPYISKDLKNYLIFPLIPLGLVIFFVGAVMSYKASHMRTPKNYRPRDGLIKEFKLNTKCDTLHSVSIQNYSEYADQLIEKNPKQIFTVCAFEPSEIMYFLCDSLSKKERCTKTLNDIKSHPSFLNFANEFFPHFETFRKFYREDSFGHHNIIRILVLKDTKFADRNKKWMFEKFRELNGNIPCFVITKNSLEPSGVTFITDHVIYDDKFVIDYYDDSNTFILSCVEGAKDLKRILLGIRGNFKSNRAGYVDLDSFISDSYA